ncbi:MAG: 2-amino-4-hydroxy-6-hydroxymethyldihydropteridine diphosphokinase [Deferribacteraceae bacterium]|jgi:2-amino-4-hydroxy-6-hydroxymethyldihydropteridine diphosphokinase|nr:2-amino-4-hydroxy-6-hydroxymethyldihydropteridine diphosphokinase [Deferribacteraceae bacterium]
MTAEKPMTNVILALGGNTGDVQRAFTAALQHLQDTGALEDINVSRTYQSRSLLRDDQPDYYNCVCTSRTPLSPLAFLQAAKKTEQLFGRQDKEGRWQERALDIDIIDYGAMIIKEDTLFIPHPMLESRSFVLFPMRELTPQYIHPENGLTIEQMCGAIKDNLDIRVV